MGKLVIIFISLVILVTITIIISARKQVDKMPEMIIQNELTEQVQRIGNYALTFAVKQLTDYSVPLSGGSVTQRFDNFRVFDGSIDSLKYSVNTDQDSVVIRAYTYCRISGHEIYHESETLVYYIPAIVTPNGVTDVITSTGTIVVKGSADIEGTVSQQDTTFVFEEIFGYTKAEIENGATHLYVDPENNILPVDNVTWVNFVENDDFQITDNNWEGSGLLIINGDMRISGGDFTGIIWVVGSLVVTGNPNIQGALYVEGDVEITKITGNPTIHYNEDAVSSSYLLNLSSAFNILTWYN